MNYPVLDYLKRETNKIDQTKQAIIFMSQSDELITKKFKEAEENAMNNLYEKEPEIVYFDPNEIERIVLKRNENKGMES